ncbi:MAG: GNAT family N-acetyltransferase [Prevotella sp.]|nr:GNAT family N-acetyltransferase [Prevotella sp.]
MQNEITIRPARAEDASVIAELVTMAMTDECCMHFCGERHTPDDFRTLIAALAARRGTQYSYENTICATTGDGRIAGISVSYDGSLLFELRQAFIDGAKAAFNIDHSGMSAETQAGELYLDSLAVYPEYRGRGIAKKLIDATADKAKRMGTGPVGLLVDENNPKAERLYLSQGFAVVNLNEWGGHKMKHMQKF